MLVHARLDERVRRLVEESAHHDFVVAEILPDDGRDALEQAWEVLVRVGAVAPWEGESPRRLSQQAFLPPGLVPSSAHELALRLAQGAGEEVAMVAAHALSSALVRSPRRGKVRSGEEAVEVMHEVRHELGEGAQWWSNKLWMRAGRYDPSSWRWAPVTRGDLDVVVVGQGEEKVFVLVAVDLE